MSPALSPDSAGAPSSAAAAVPMPPPRWQRLDSLDLLRGIAILGIFLMNTWTFSLPQNAYTNLNAYTTDWVQGDTQQPGHFPDDHELVHGADFYTYCAIHLVADMKFITMFSMLFGAGILLQGERAAGRGLPPWRIHYGRMAVLLLFGLAHAYLIWYGDILITYAMCGMLLFPLRKAPAGYLLLLGILMVAMASVINFATMEKVDISLPGGVGVLQSFSDWNTSQIEGKSGNDFELAAYRGTWSDEMKHRVPTSFSGDTDGFITWSLWRCGGCILIGMALHKRKFFHGLWSREAYASIAALAIPIGWAVTGMGIIFNETIGWTDTALDEPASSVFSVWGLGVEFNYWGSIITELGYLSLGVLVAIWAAQHGREVLRRCLWPLRAIGRMALSNYIAQSLIAGMIFYGHGFGLFGTMTRFQLLGVVFSVWIVQLIVSPIYLSMFRQGPLEWLWHRLVYWRGEPPPLKDAEEVS